MDVDLGFYDQQEEKIGIDHNKKQKKEVTFLQD